MGNKCKFNLAWSGSCNTEISKGEYCDSHLNIKCCSCGEQATRECEETMGLVCGAPLCENCEHTTRSNGCNSGAELPKGLKGHCKKDEQIYKAWYQRKNSTDVFRNSKEDTRTKYLSEIGKNAVLISDFVGLKIYYVKSGNPMDGEDYDMEITCPDFLDHDNDLLYLYDKDLPYDELKYHSDWNWLMGVVDKISDYLQHGEEVDIDYYVMFNEISFINLSIDDLYNMVVEFIKYLSNKNEK